MDKLNGVEKEAPWVCTSQTSEPSLRLFTKYFWVRNNVFFTWGFSLELHLVEASLNMARPSQGTAILPGSNKYWNIDQVICPSDDLSIYEQGTFSSFCYNERGLRNKTPGVSFGYHLMCINPTVVLTLTSYCVAEGDPLHSSCKYWPQALPYHLIKSRTVPDIY